MIEFLLYDRANNFITTFDGRNTKDTPDRVFKKGERYRVRAVVTEAKIGNFIFKME